ncbi:MAG: NADH-quinone oxidoreductase subunit NuoG [Gammaproteobacteria bacterium]|nr:NADH-quinone oxidoreductase subunit NuoG [Gammaproteobacteria bacterium]MDX2458733.1 NADH-quinone oxidoreductase subunit NuoG [Gammaproteobacteria bacterium]
MNDSLITIEINGQSLQAKKGAMLIEVADEAGIEIPRFCYHKKLSVAANCRMCLVEVEKAPKPLPACATPVMDGMKVFTRSPLALKAQKSVMEFLLINHPLDCPICDQGGECELQDVAMGYGKGVSRFVERKRVVADKNIGPLVATEMTRCIHCTRCVRFGEEIGGMPELGATGRGEHMQIGTFIERALDSEMSGNIIDLCPVGALTSKPFRFRARAWEMQQRDAIAPHDAVGSNVHVHVRDNRVMRVVPRENEAVNEVWISDRDRFSYEGLYHEERLLEPMIKRDGEWHVVDWETALARAVEGFKAVRSRQGPGQIGGLFSASATAEELYLGQKLLRGVGCANIDHRLRETDFRDQAHAPSFPWLGLTIAAVERLEAVLLVGAYPRKEHPIINHRLRKATLAGADIMVLGPPTDGHNYRVAEQLDAGPLTIQEALAGIAAACVAREGRATELSGMLAGETEKRIAERLCNAERAAVFVGCMANTHPRASRLRTLAAYVAQTSGASYGNLSDGANGAGAWLAGVLPHRGPGGKSAPAEGLSATEMLAANLSAYLTLGIEPELDCADGGKALSTLRGAECVVSLTAYRTETMMTYADVLLPTAPFAETSGTYVNAEGSWQTMSGAVTPPGEARPAWKVLRVLGNLFELEGFDYQDSSAVLGELRERVANVAPSAPEQSPLVLDEGLTAGDAIFRIGTVPMYSSDALVRRAPALQRTADGTFRGVHINSTLARSLGLSDGEHASVRQNGTRMNFAVVVDDKVPDGCAGLAAGIVETAGLGPSFGPMEIEKA